MFLQTVILQPILCLMTLTYVKRLFIAVQKNQAGDLIYLIDEGLVLFLSHHLNRLKKSV